MNTPKQLLLVILLGILHCDAALAQSDLLDDPTSTWDLLLTVARYEDDSMEGFANYKVIRVSAGAGPAGLEIVEYYEVDEQTGRSTKLNPAEVQKLQAAAATEAGTGLDKDAFADALVQASGGANLFGAMLEAQFASMGAGTPFGAQLFETVRTSTVNGRYKSDCDIAKEVNTARTQGSDIQAVQAALSPLAMMTEMSCFLQIGAEIMRTEYEGADASSLGRNDAVLAAADDIEFHGRTEYDDQPAYLLTMDNLGISEPTDDGGVVNLDRVRTYISAVHYKQIAVLWSGTWEQDGQSRDIFFGETNSDFRTVPGTNMIHPYKTTTTMGGFLDEEQQQQIQEAAEQLDDMERQLAAMPASQRQMMQKMMGGQLESIRAMANSGTMDFTLLTKRIMVNSDILSGEAAYAMGNPKALNQEIQYDLHTLGYEPGNYTGEIDKATIAAIIKFQRDYRLELTGEATPELGRVLSATVSTIN